MYPINLANSLEIGYFGRYSTPQSLHIIQYGAVIRNATCLIVFPCNSLISLLWRPATGFVERFRVPDISISRLASSRGVRKREVDAERDPFDIRFRRNKTDEYWLLNGRAITKAISSTWVEMTACVPSDPCDNDGRDGQHNGSTTARHFQNDDNIYLRQTTGSIVNLVRLRITLCIYENGS